MRNDLREVNALVQAEQSKSFVDCEDEGDVFYDLAGATWDITDGRGASELR